MTRSRFAFVLFVLCGCAGTGSRVPALMKALKSERPDARAEAARKLGELGDAAKPAVPALLEAVRDRHPAVYRAVSGALIRLGDAARPGLMALAGEGAAWLRCRAVETLGRLDPAPESVPVFMKALADHDECVNAKAADALGRAGDVAVPPLVSALKSNNLAVRRGAAEALGKMDPAAQERAAFPLVQDLRGKDEYARGAAELLLSEMGRPAIPSLLALLDDPEPDLRRRAVVSLGRIGIADDAVLAGLLGRLKDKDRIVHLKAALALGELGERDARVLPVLAARLSTEDVDLRRGLVSAIGNMGPGGRDAVPALIGLLSDEDKETREEASEALMKIGTLDATDAAERHNRKNLK